MIEYNLPISSFIGGWFINNELCDELVNFFNNNEKFHTKGVIKENNQLIVNEQHKLSTDLNIAPSFNDNPILEYKKQLAEVVKLYCNKYNAINDIGYFGLIEPFCIQYYKKGEGFKKWHSERMSNSSEDRVLVFMTYLKDCEHAGTEFKHQALVTPSKKGLTLIWPAEWTHTHKGQISFTEEKYIITGWLNFIKNGPIQKNI
jgi:hypothetical protein